MWGHECKSSWLVAWSLQKYLERRRATLNETGRSVSVSGNEETHIRELNSVMFTCNSIIHCSRTINSSTLTNHHLVSHQHFSRAHTHTHTHTHTAATSNTETQYFASKTQKRTSEKRICTLLFNSSVVLYFDQLTYTAITTTKTNHKE